MSEKFRPEKLGPAEPRPETPGSSSAQYAAVVLAAGASRRLGQPKQLIRIAGESLLRRSARLAVEAGCARVLVVLGHEAASMRPELDGLPAEAVVNAAWQEGMGSSLRAGVAAAASARPTPAGVLILVCDQLRLRAEHLKALMDEHHSGGCPIVASAYGSRVGVPALFSWQVVSELLSVTGDQGAREVIRQDPRRVETIPWPEGEFDLDRPDQLEESKLR